MRRTGLENVILDYIKTLYNAEYVGYLRVFQEDDSYTLQIGLPSYMTLTNISRDSASDTEFLDFIKEEFRTRNYMRQDIYKVIRTNEDRKE